MLYKTRPASFLLLLLFLNLSYLTSLSQCLTDFGKILPDTTLATLQEYGASVAVHGEYVAVGSPSNDSIKYNGGMVFIYQKSANIYNKVATIFPKEDLHYSNFGYAIDLNDSYLVVTALGDNSIFEENPKPKLYIFKKPDGGWKDNGSEIILSGYGGNLFGIEVHITDDSKNILVGNLKIADGSIFSFRIGPSGWEAGVGYQEIMADPKYLLETRNIDFGETFAVYNEYLAIGGRYSYYDGKYGGIFLFKDEIGDGLNYNSIALLQGKNDESYFLGPILCDNIENNYGFYVKNKSKRAKPKDRLEALKEWNRKSNPKVFQKLLHEHKTVCTAMLIC